MITKMRKDIPEVGIIPKVGYTSQIEFERSRILQHNTDDRLIEARLLFRWVLLEEKVYQLQFQNQEGLYLDWLQVKKIPNS